HLKTGVVQGDPLDRAQAFLFQWNLDQLPAITFWTRLVSWVFGLFMGALLFGITRSNAPLCASTLFFWALDPTFLALAGLSKIEMIPDFFFFLALWLFARALEKEEGTSFFLAGLSAAAAMTAKYHTWALVPIFLILFLNRRAKRALWLLPGWALG